MKSHKRYLGNFISIYCILALFVFLMILILFSICVLTAKISPATIFIFIMCIFLGSLLLYYSFSVANQLFTWCEFCEKYIIIKTLFYRPYKIYYSKCSDVGIGYYIHGVLNSHLGTKIKYIYFSYYKVEKTYKSHINLLKPTKTFIKIGYRKSTYEFLLKNLPPKQAVMLEKSYINHNSIIK